MKRENTPRLETPRLTLRKFTEDDLEDLFLIFRNEEVNRFLPWPPFRTMDDARNYLHGNLFADYAKEHAYRYAIEERKGHRVIGYVSLFRLNEKNGSGDLGYGLKKEFWGRGIVTEAAGAVLARLRANGFAFVTATHDVNNPGSGRVMEKLGLTYRHSYEEQWQPKNLRVRFNLYRIDF